MTRPRVILLRSIAIVCGTVIGVLGVELALRVIDYDTRSMRGGDPVSMALLEQIHTHDGGARDQAIRLGELQGRGALVAIGDSYTFGSGIANAADRYSELLSQSLGIPVLNLGVPGKNFPWHTGVGDRAIRLIRPAGIILQLTLNDVSHYFKPASCGDRARWNMPESWRALAPSSRLLVALNRARVGLLSHVGSLPSYEDWLICMHQDPTRPAYERFVRDLRVTMETWLRRVDFVVLMIWPWYTETRPYPFEHVHELLAVEARLVGASVVDLHEQTRFIPVAELRINDYDAHPNEAANALAARALADHLARNGLVERPSAEAR